MSVEFDLCPKCGQGTLTEVGAGWVCHGCLYIIAREDRNDNGESEHPCLRLGKPRGSCKGDGWFRCCECVDYDCPHEWDTGAHPYCLHCGVPKPNLEGSQ